MTNPKPPVLQCQNCAHARKSDRELHVWHCHRYPPAMLLVPAHGGFQLAAVQTMVHPENFCGEHATNPALIH